MSDVTGGPGAGESPDPGSIRDAGEFIAGLRALREWSGFTYRELTARAEAVGDVLPRSTVANMLARTTLPREELVAAYVRACGSGPGTVDSWLKVRKELAAAGARGAEEARDSGTEAADGAGGGSGGAGAGAGAGKRRTVLAVPVVLALVAAVAAGLFAWGGGDEDKQGGGPGGDRGSTAASEPAGRRGSGPGSRPVAGERLVKVGESDLCLTERSGSSGHLYQGPCAGAIPRFTLVPRAGGTWRIATLHPTYGEGCMGVQRSSRQTPAPLENDYCGRRGKAETFRLEPVARPVEGYRIRPLHTGFCLGVDDGGPDAADRLWAEVVQTECAADAARQIFRFEPPVRASAARSS
ncbi:hypothetical protein AR457_11195 [Streptomyces agglomeratus]|uniref:helix-turn-helix domain-containing protein n=1 Tax=Streptomyces agglomeratus TaxID=285458 RepID=UPI0008544B64|nr:XRE family transcriptional regulator [Streptomyces agglomeratus]OEJ41038.1 hypothetical protein BGK70_25460 [Streptomyces agglomeratus]OEJ44584.1 hypothetical protein AR457_11195 [Streptomyces agglomeratus]